MEGFARRRWHRDGGRRSARHGTEPRDADESLSPPVDAAPAGRMTRRVVLVTIVAVLGAVVWWLTGPETDPERVWAEAQRALQEQRIDDAARLADRLARLREPKDVDWMLRAQVAAAQGRPDAALTAIRRVPETSPLASQAELFAGRIELRRHRFRDAEAHLRLALELEPELAEARRELIYILGFQLRRGELDEQFRALAKTGGARLRPAPVLVPGPGHPVAARGDRRAARAGRPGRPRRRRTRGWRSPRACWS